jgi:hypothetical protein
MGSLQKLEVCVLSHCVLYASDLKLQVMQVIKPVSNRFIVNGARSSPNERRRSSHPDLIDENRLRVAFSVG